ncbi:helix-turn-helix transcriptional regulator [Paraeggerthella hongkongensis]|uniref:LuxR family transcriptional regulator n=1 Tax=Paraeggerthella hongkongensis TaxID=230658 RepID=A0A3N0BGM4_9ACTN|nr:helix-turn-helix transcriptional regulator [Paraeggerthella hongkongensis]RNL47139.1 LuxR family transcriptional regulator [Paraeggerthella hongkongensis]
MESVEKQGFAQRWKAIFGRVAIIPFVFFGVGLYRAWIATLFRYEAFPTITVFDYFLFEAAIGVVSLALAFAARRVAPLWANRPAVIATGASMTGGSALVVIACFFVPFEPLKVVGLLLAGGGLGSLILMWAEFYGSLNPLRVALYHAIAIFVGEVVKWLFLGMSVPYLAFFAVVLPPICLACVRSSMRRLPDRDLPRAVREGDVKTIPWKPIFLMATCTFAAAFGALPMQPLVPGNVVGALFVTGLVFFGVLSASRWFNFDTIYQLAFPLFIVGFLFVMPSFAGSAQIMALCYDAGYTMLSMYIMIVMSNITYRFGVNAVWINGIERGIRYLVELLGWLTFAGASAYLGSTDTSMVYNGIVVAVVVAFLVIFFTERGLSAKWGVALNDDQMESGPAEGRTAMRVSDLSRVYSLSPREEEVLQLLAQRATVAEIEEALYVSQGTVKAHVNHIYRKLGIHSKAELFGLLDSPEKPARR